MLNKVCSTPLLAVLQPDNSVSAAQVRFSPAIKKSFVSDDASVMNCIFTHNKTGNERSYTTVSW
jgi:hypothetical protein